MAKIGRPISQPSQISQSRMTEAYPTIAVLGPREMISVPNWGELLHYAIFEKYLKAIRDCVSPFSIILPTHIFDYLEGGGSLDPLLKNIDGVVLPGGSSNIQSSRYGYGTQVGKTDPERDEVALTLVSRCVALDIPLLGICRGFQEINVALGGTLNSSLEDNPIRHRSRPQDPMELKYSSSHEVLVTSRGAQLLGLAEGVYAVNSLHGQGIECLSSNLSVDAVAPDGLIEAASFYDQAVCVAGVQWHPEWSYEKSALCSATFRRFRLAAINRMNQRL